MISTATQRLLSFLSDIDSYPHHPPQVTLVQTHASWVFIAPPFVYKIKKPVNLGFLDFSTLELRHADCEHELVLNRRLAEDIYLGLKPICESDGSLHFGSDGVIVEWAVKMRQMDPRYFLKQLMQDQAVGIPEMDRIVDKLHRFYATQPPLPKSAVTTANEHLRQGTEDNFKTARQFVGQSLSQHALDAIALYTREFFTRQSALLDSRLHDGWIRDCHGDLHLDHIHLSPEAVRIYDCIEFNTDFRCIDVACDIAFLAMDLDFNDRPDLSRHIVERFAVLLEDSGMKPLMDFYKCYRACVRGKVESMHANAETVADAEKQSSLQLARRYFQLALQYAVTRSKPCVFVFMGKVASGKSALAEALSQETGWPIHSSDRLRKTLAGTPLNHRGSKAERDALYAPEMTQKTYDLLFEQALASLHKGHSVILDATFSKLDHRNALKQLMASEGCDVRWIEACAGEPVVRERLQERDQDATVVSDARLEDYKLLSANYEPPHELQPNEKLSILTDGKLDQVLDVLLSDLVIRQQQSIATANLDGQS
ncbi:AAA family ATPase [Prosthecobacter sp.]|uniref:bifunctional aminoglycoside phosphotransferase/ATP-binding protein n=1 Tax=Prosthecobacter sp. TaxID=1965333 RepID=UPI002ABBBD94|nr:AAA family ATPase [Prosthecobacter sp.]MDZ4403593.1 AAA family ATPase [Prosthecobacter sp.]